MGDTKKLEAKLTKHTNLHYSDLWLSYPSSTFPVLQALSTEAELSSIDVEELL